MSASGDDDRDRAGEPGDPNDRLNASEVDERFAELIAELKAQTPPWPDDTETETDQAAAKRAHPSSATSEPDEPSLLELWDADVEEEEPEEDAAYRPPPPPPVPVPSLPAILGVLLIVGGLVLIVSPQLLDVGEGLGRATGIAAFGGGVLTLIWRLRPEPADGEDDDPDSGAVVLRTARAKKSRRRTHPLTATAPNPAQTTRHGRTHRAPTPHRTRLDRPVAGFQQEELHGHQDQAG